ncbi:hypothetical protein [Dictyobacter kobayashii]|uniref:Uncharacterized protein n=1 Tax=Dictyobacter kobayashii TaxID=2014872 RepID=A0A402AGQ8_9CHLR|nr:hypothetical protein [Dictyobacter kobayashii]GCE18265.1 hypothetical protein KDK_20650 [Dictyobacter kobayashii]
MSQNYNTVAKRPRRTRVPRNRPVLVTDTETQEGTLPPTTEDLELDTAPAVEDVVSEPVATPKRLSRLPKFFSKVERSEQDGPADEKEVVDARMARARKNMNPKTAIVKAEEAAEAKEKPAAAKARPATRPSLFKPRHMFGMVIYLIGANLLLPLERTFAINMHIEKTVFTVPFINNLPVTTSFLLNILTLIVLLYALVAFDLLPNGKQFASSQTQANKAKTGSSTAGTPTPKVAPPVMRQGVKGEHDDLYQAYRSQQRKKR